MRIFLEPNEALLFRTGRPFDAGETDYAETLFPPTPETIQGAVRALIATAQDSSATPSELFRPGSALVSLIGDRQSYGRFRITNIALARRLRDTMDIESLYPVPAHLLRDNRGFFRLRPVEQNEIRSNMPAGMRYLMPDEQPVGKMQLVEGWLTATDLQKVLSADSELSDLHIISNTDVFLHEPRLGIGMDNATKSTRDGMLYSVQMLRMRQDYRSDQGFLYSFGFLVDVRLADETDPARLLPDDQTRSTLNLQTHQQGWMILGGEQRAASYSIVGESQPLPHQVTHPGYKTLLYLATPAVLANGWRPAHWPSGDAPIAAAIPRYQPIGGWRLQPGHSGGENKSMRRCVPAGSVYFFDSIVSLPAVLTDDYGKEIGYGITIAGEW